LGIAAFRPMLPEIAMDDAINQQATTALLAKIAKKSRGLRMTSGTTQLSGGTFFWELT
jgi:hypothetical protein